MKKLITLLTLAGLTFSPAYSQDFFSELKEGSKVNFEDIKEYQIGPAFTIGNEKDGYFLVVNYDFNKNGIMDAQIEYSITDKEWGIPMPSKYASKVVVDKNEDLTVDEVYWDEDKDGILEKKFHNN